MFTRYRWCAARTTYKRENIIENFTINFTNLLSLRASCVRRNAKIKAKKKRSFGEMKQQVKAKVVQKERTGRRRA